MKKFGFSLVELMIAVTIIAVIAAIAMPVYQQYAIRAKVAKVYNYVIPWMHELAKDYAISGNMPGTVNFGGVTVPEDAATVVDTDSIYVVWWQTARPPDSYPSFRLDVSIKGLEGIPGYTDPSTVGWGDTASILRFVMRDEDGIMTIVCGKYGGYDGQELPSAYAPTQCNCTNLGYYFFFGKTTPTCY